MKRISFSVAFISLAFFVSSQNLKVEVEGEAVFGNSIYSIGEAGEDFPASVESETSVLISVLFTDFWDKKNNPDRKWSMHIHKSDLIWDENLHLQAKRTGKGIKPEKNGSTNIHDGESFQNITNTNTYFIRGKDEIAFIPILLKLSGFSIAMGAGEYETKIFLTVYDDW